MGLPIALRAFFAVGLSYTKKRKDGKPMQALSVREIDELGRILIPRAVRGKVNWHIGDIIVFYQKGNGLLLLRQSREEEVVYDDKPEYDPGA